MNKDAKFTQEDKFYLNGDEQNEKFELPYATMEIVFNQKNVFANLGNQNPQQILYHFHKDEDWLPFVTTEKTKGKDEDEEDDDDDDDDDDLDEDDDDDLGPKQVAWMQKMGAFYGGQILSEPLRKDKLKKILSNLYTEHKRGNLF